MITLPTYPFARERYWLDASAAEPQPENTVERAPEAERCSVVASIECRLSYAISSPESCASPPISSASTENCSEYGADSITAMRLMRAVEQELHLKITGRDLLEHRTIQALSTYLVARIDAPQATGVTAALSLLPPGEGWGEGSPRPLGTCAPLSRSPGEKSQEPIRPTAPDALDRFKQGSLTLEEMEALLAQGEML